MEAQVLNAESRAPEGTRVARKLRDSGRLPGVIYGHGEKPEWFSVDTHELNRELEHGHRLVKLSLSGKTDSFLIKSVQYNHLGSDPIHLDLMRVDLQETVEVQVAIELVGTAKGAKGGAVLDQPLQHLHVECRAGDIPDLIKVRVNDLDVNESLTVADLEIPDGVTVQNAPHEVVAIVKAIAEEETPEEDEDVISAEPEVINRGKDEKEEDAG